MPERAAFVVEASRPTKARPERVIEILLRPDQRPAWQPEIVAMRGPYPLTRGDAQEGIAEMLGFRVQGRSTIVDASSDGFEEDVIVGVRMRILYEVERQGAETLVRHRLEADLPQGPMGRILSFFLKRRLKAMQKAALVGLVRQSEEAPFS